MFHLHTASHVPLQAAVRSVQFSPDNSKLVTGADDKAVKVGRGGLLEIVVVVVVVEHHGGGGDE